jgi:uncharacterized SAM-binding protein YcdF (DUF218 family)
LRRIIAAFAALLLMSGGVFFIKAGSFLAMGPSQLAPVDLIVILGGDTGARSMRGTELYRQGFAPWILLTGLEEGEAQTRSFYLNWRSQYLVHGGIPPKRILFDANSQTTWDEARNTLELMKKRAWRRVIVVSDPPHMRRLHWVWGKAFKGSGLEYSLCASKPSWWDERKWWRNESSAKFVIAEYLKMAFYFIKYP